MSEIKELAGKRILITSWSYSAFGGAALNAVELASKLVEFGMTPTFFSYDIEGPLRDKIEEMFGTTVLTDQVYDLAESDNEKDMGNTQININDFDYIWVGGNTLPISIINQINNTKKLPKFIFIHMSQLIAYPLDAPLMPSLEKSIASKILSISGKTTTDCIKRILGADVVVDYWKNPVPDDFIDIATPQGALRRVAVISSSHPSDEIMSIEEPLNLKGVKVDYIGKFNNNTKVVDAEFYSGYDLIIGIGKDVRYSLVSGIPVYVYGRFGGCGYLNNDNLELAEDHNLSGRGFGKKKPDTIVEDIINGYQDALNFHQSNKNKFSEEMAMGSAAKRLFMDLEAQESIKATFSDEYVNWLVTSQINIMQRMKISHARRHWGQRAATLQDENRAFSDEVGNLQSRVSGLQLEKSEIQKNTSSMYHSTSWRITKPLRLMNKMAKSLRNRADE